ncbi:hypothetical protein TNCV_111861 [Trichonephila clavipes]|nr:hypothetical protein TNCV_111861 [Trichonephila clavipes]
MIQGWSETPDHRSKSKADDRALKEVLEKHQGARVRENISTMIPAISILIRKDAYGGHRSHTYSSYPNSW